MPYTAVTTVNVGEKTVLVVLPSYIVSVNHQNVIGIIIIFFKTVLDCW